MGSTDRTRAAGPGAEYVSPHLDALRILASLAIVVLHYANYVKDLPVGSFVYHHTQHFNLFVDLFFVISGFVIASQYLNRVADRRSVGRFLWRRLARIYPLHAVTLAFYVAIALALHAGYVRVENPERYVLGDVPAHIFLLHAIIGDRLTFNFPSWSLSAEMLCYLLFPLMAIVALRRPRAILPLAAAIAVALTVYVLFAGVPWWTDWINEGGAFRALPAFLLGTGLYLYRAKVGKAPLGAVLLPGFAFFVFFGWALPGLAALALVYLVAAAAVHCDVAGTRSLIVRSGVGRLAHLTYSTYMLHMPVATFVVTVAGRYVGRSWHDTPFALVASAFLILPFVSALSYHLFENPLRRRLNAAFDRIGAARARWPDLIPPRRKMS